MTHATQLDKMRTELANLRAYKFNRTKVFVRAHYLVRTEYKTLSEALKQCYAETRAYALKVASKIKEIVTKLADRFTVKPESKDWNQQFKDEIKKNPNFNPYNK